MSVEAIIGIVYGGGCVAGLFYVGAKDIRWSDGYGFFGPAWIFLLWPLAAPVVFGKALRRRAERQRLAAEEHRRWLELPIPDSTPGKWD